MRMLLLAAALLTTPALAQPNALFIDGKRANEVSQQYVNDCHMLVAGISDMLTVAQRGSFCMPPATRPKHPAAMFTD